MSVYPSKFTEVRDMLDGRYDYMKCGRVQPVHGEDAFAACAKRARIAGNKPP